MNILLTAIANFITEHYILTFLLLISIFQVRIDIGKKKKDERPKNEKETTDEEFHKFLREAAEKGYLTEKGYVYVGLKDSKKTKSEEPKRV